MKSEKGYTLVLVMIIITITMIFALALSSATLSTTKQFKKTDNINKSTDIAEMGVTYYHQSITDILNAANANKNIDFCTNFKSLESINSNSIYSTKFVESNSYKIDRTSTNINCTNTNEFTLEFKSTGKTSSGESKILYGSFTISSTGQIIAEKVGQSLPDTTSSNSLFYRIPGRVKINGSGTAYYDKVNYPNGVSFLDTLEVNSNITVDKDVYVNQLDLKGNGTVYFKQNAIIKLVEKMNSHTGITIDNDAIFIFDRKTFLKEPGKNSTICIKGNIYSVDTNKSPMKLELFSDFTDFFTNTCSNKNENIIWNIPEDGIKVTY